MSVSENNKRLVPQERKTPVAKPGVENRRSPRIECNFPLTIELMNGVSLTAWTHDISPEGLFVEYDIAETDGAVIKINERLKVVLNSPFLTIRGAWWLFPANQKTCACCAWNSPGRPAANPDSGAIR